MIKNTHVQTEWLSVRQVHEYMGGNLPERVIRELMKTNQIRSVWIGNKLVTRIADVKAWEQEIFESKTVVRGCGAKNIVPVAHIMETNV